jgi:hypothetical protein
MTQVSGSFIMTSSETAPADPRSTGPGSGSAASWGARALPLAAILLVAVGLRLWRLDRTSLWYDEVITMRVVRADNPTSLVRRLDQLDGTRAPLHPLVLQAWLRVFGSSDLAGRSFSAVCGVVTVVIVYVLGRRAFDEASGRWAAWLTAVCPPLVYYIGGNSLVLLACLAIIGFGLLSHEQGQGWGGLALASPIEYQIFITWAAVPSGLMYVYSELALPIFGPARYHLFIAPA